MLAPSRGVKVVPLSHYYLLFQASHHSTVLCLSQDIPYGLTLAPLFIKGLDLFIHDEDTLASMTQPPVGVLGAASASSVAQRASQASPDPPPVSATRTYLTNGRP